MVIVDACTKWMEVHITDASTAQVTIDKIRSTLAAVGLPKQVVTDNGPVGKHFLERNGVQNCKTSPITHRHMVWQKEQFRL